MNVLETGWVVMVVGGLFAIEMPAGTMIRIKERLLAPKQPL